MFTRGVPLALLFSKWLVDVHRQKHLQPERKILLHAKLGAVERGESGETLTQSSGRTVATVCIVMSVAVYAVTPTTGLCCCFSAALQRPAPPLAHNFRPVSPATRVSAHGEQPTSPDESFCQYSHDHWEREGERREEKRGRRREMGERKVTLAHISLIYLAEA